MKPITKKQVMEKAKISKNVLTSYCEELEEQGYYFDINGSGHRTYNEDDLAVFIRIKECLHQFQTINLKLSEAVNLVLTNHDYEIAEDYQQLMKASAEVAGAVEYDITDLTEPPITAVELVERISTEFNEMKFAQYQMVDRMNTIEDSQIKMFEAFEKIEKDRDQVLMMNLRLTLDNKEQMNRIERKLARKKSWKFWKKNTPAN